jgi:hypothetical protein
MIWKLSKGITVKSNKKLENVIFVVKLETTYKSHTHIELLNKTISPLKNINIIYVDGNGHSVTKYKL